MGTATAPTRCRRIFVVLNSTNEFHNCINPKYLDRRPKTTTCDHITIMHSENLSTTKLVWPSVFSNVIKVIAGAQ